MDAALYPVVYPLTELTHAGERRRVIVSGFDVPLRVVVIVAVGFVPGLLLTVLLFPLLGTNAVVAIPASIIGLYALVEARSSQGMRLPRWKALLLRYRDRHRVESGFVIGQTSIDIEQADLVLVVPSSLPILEPAP